MISQYKIKEYLEYDYLTGMFTRIKIRKNDRRNKVGDAVANNIRDGYLRVNIEGKLYSAHILAWIYHFGVEPKNTIDHINRNKLDNRISNLRDVSMSINKINQSVNKRNVTGTTGVYYCKKSKKFTATITPPNSKRIRLGNFTSMSDAINARKDAESKYFTF